MRSTHNIKMYPNTGGWLWSIRVFQLQSANSVVSESTNFLRFGSIRTCCYWLSGVQHVYSVFFCGHIQNHHSGSPSSHQQAAAFHPEKPAIRLLMKDVTWGKLGWSPLTDSQRREEALEAVSLLLLLQIEFLQKWTRTQSSCFVHIPSRPRTRQLRTRIDIGP